MMKNRCLALLACMVVLAALGCSKKKEVVYQGKPLSTWIEMLKDRENPSQRYAAVEAIIRMGPAAKDATPALIEMIREIRNVDKRLLFACDKALLGMGKEIVPDMVALLKDDNWEMRRGAAVTLGRLGSEAKEAVPALTKALNDTNAAVRVKAEEALKKIKGENGEINLREQIGDKKAGYPPVESNKDERPE